MLTIYIEDGFLKEFEKMSPENSYGVRFLWELHSKEGDNHENHKFIFEDIVKTADDLEKMFLSSKFKKKAGNGNSLTKSLENLASAHLLFVTTENKIKIETKGIVFTLDDFEERIKEYAAMDNFLGFLENKTDWGKFLVDLKKFPGNNFYMADGYFFNHEKNMGFLSELFSDDWLNGSRCKIYTTTYLRKLDKDDTSPQNTAQKKELIEKQMECLQDKYDLKNIEVIDSDKKYGINWHDRELVTDYAIVMSGIGFKSNYDNRTNNKISQYNIFTKDGRRVIKEQLKRFNHYENQIEEKKRVFCSYPESNG